MRIARLGAGLLVLVMLGAVAAAAAFAAGSRGGRGSDKLPVNQMEQILQAEGTVTNGVLDVSLDRTDIGTITLHDYATNEDIPIVPSFELNGDLTFQPIGNDQAIFNGDIALKPNEVDRVISAIISNNLVFQAEHQHFYDFQPPVWFIHFRGKGDPITLAKEVHAVVEATATPLPQAPPPHPKTPLDPQRLKRILHGYDVSVADDGVVTVDVARKDTITLDGVQLEPQTNIETPVVFEPLNSSGSRTAVAPDFGMTASEVMPVVSLMRGLNWDIGCLYNQETAEQPQLYFSHEIKTGDPYALAQEVRRGLDLMNTQ